MPDKNTDPQAVKTTIKEWLLSCFVRAVFTLGNDWSTQLAAHYPCFNTRNGVNNCNAESATVRNSRRASADCIEWVSAALEELMDVKNKAI